MQVVEFILGIGFLLAAVVVVVSWFFPFKAPARRPGEVEKANQELSESDADEGILDEGGVVEFGEGDAVSYSAVVDEYEDY